VHSLPNSAKTQTSLVVGIRVTRRTSSEKKEKRKQNETKRDYIG